MVKKISKRSISKTSAKSDKKVRRAKKHHERNFGNPIFKVLKEIHNDIGMSSGSSLIMNSLVLDNMNKILSESAILLKKENKRLLTFSDIQSAVKLVFPGELAKHAMSEGLKAVNKFKSSRDS